MVAWFALGNLALKAYNRRNGKTGSAGTAAPKKPMSASNRLRLWALLPVIFCGVAVILSFLCVFAGSKPGYMEEHAVFTLNTSRVGENILQKLDSKIMSVKLSKRDVSDDVFLPAITPAPTATAVLVDRDLNSITSMVGGAAHSAQTAAASAAHSAGSAVSSKASAAQSAAASAANSALAAAQTNLVHVVDTAYHDVMKGLNFSDWHSIHVSSSCYGIYEYANGTNVTDASAPAADAKVKKIVTACEPHSAVNPLQLVRILYWIGIVLTCVAFICDLVSISVPFNRKFSLVACTATIPALFVFFLASAVTHGIAKGAKTFINFIGSDIGVAGYSGSKFLQMTWTTVVLLLLNILGFAFIWWKSGRVNKEEGRKRPDRTSGIAMQPVISHPLPVAHPGDGRDGWI